MKFAKVGKGKSRSLYGSFLWMTLLPLCLCSVLMIGMCSYFIKSNICDQTRTNLKNISSAVLATYDAMYEGDYNISMNGHITTMWKGDAILSNNYSYLDKIASDAGVDISLFFFDTRLLTTIKDADGNRMINTGVNGQVLDTVFTGGNEAFYDNVRIGKTDYFAYYSPLYSQDGDTILGMIGVASPSSIVNKAVRKSVAMNVIIMIAAMAITAFFIIRFASQIVLVIKKMMEFMKSLSENDLDVTLDEGVSYRDDELGVMGRFMIGLQSSLKKLIERDVLTGLYNRRSAERKLDDTEKNYATYCVAIGDIDHFKKFNDTFGHECGDVVLRDVARVLNESMKGKGFVARWGGEEFLLVYQNAGIDEAYVALLGVRDALHAHEVEYNGDIHKVTMTFGVEEKQKDMPINMLIRAADDMLYEGKQGGRDRVCRRPAGQSNHSGSSVESPSEPVAEKLPETAVENVSEPVAEKLPETAVENVSEPATEKTSEIQELPKEMPEAPANKLASGQIEELSIESAEKLLESERNAGE